MSRNIEEAGEIEFFYLSFDPIYPFGERDVLGRGGTMNKIDYNS